MRGGGAVPWENINYTASFFPLHSPILKISQERQDEREHSRSARAQIRSGALMGSYFSPCAVIETRLGQINANTAAHFPGASNCTAGRLDGDNRLMSFRKTLTYSTLVKREKKRSVSAHCAHLGSAPVLRVSAFVLESHDPPFKSVPAYWFS